MYLNLVTTAKTSSMGSGKTQCGIMWSDNKDYPINNVTELQSLPCR